ncbi:MAG: ABC transporter substrate-binding protein [Alphaproteobacteria bacterium]|nr:ABC transporter substrate-binding protein [Alphaproteobacteria bacterium]
MKIVLAALMLLSAPAAADSVTSHGLAMHGDLKYGPEFKHFDYVNPEAPKGGEVRLAAIGTFDSLNPFILKGVPASGLNRLYNTLAASSSDEAFSEYGEVAARFEVPADRSWVTFELRPEARWHDGQPLTADDVVFTFDLLKTKGHPQFRAYYASVVKAEKLAPDRVRFHFAPGENRELPLIVGQMSVLPKHYWETRDFEKTTLEPPLGSGPYRVESVDPGRTITYRRVPDYWGQRLPVELGQNNFDAIRVDYYRDATVVLEAFKAGQFDFRLENMAKTWATGYDFPARRQGLVKLEEIRHEQPTGMQGFAFNIRRPLFQDRRVRQALGYAFDFEWSNRNLFFDAYARTRSYFSNSELAASGLPSPAELKLLELHRGKVPEEMFTTEYQPPTSDASGNIRENLRKGRDLLEAAGWAIRDRKLVNKATGASFEFEILLNSPAFERVVLPFANNLERLGVTARVRTVDTAQYQNRVDSFDFDMVVSVFGQSLSPGNEQRDFWSAASADIPGSRNVVGVRDPVVDALIELIIAAPDRQSLIDRTHALDRVLQWGFYVIPNWHSRSFRVAYWDKFGRPAKPPRYGLGFDGWWIETGRAAVVEREKAKVSP